MRGRWLFHHTSISELLCSWNSPSPPPHWQLAFWRWFDKGRDLGLGRTAQRDLPAGFTSGPRQNAAAAYHQQWLSCQPGIVGGPSTWQDRALSPWCGIWHLLGLMNPYWSTLLPSGNSTWIGSQPTSKHAPAAATTLASLWTGKQALGVLFAQARAYHIFSVFLRRLFYHPWIP